MLDAAGADSRLQARRPGDFRALKPLLVAFLTLIEARDNRISGTRGEQGIHAACGMPANGFALASAKTGRSPFFQQAYLR
jgi:hypothetical protein